MLENGGAEMPPLPQRDIDFRALSESLNTRRPDIEASLREEIKHNGFDLTTRLQGDPVRRLTYKEVKFRSEIPEGKANNVRRVLLDGFRYHNNPDDDVNKMNMVGYRLSRDLSGDLGIHSADLAAIVGDNKATDAYVQKLMPFVDQAMTVAARPMLEHMGVTIPEGADDEILRNLFVENYVNNPKFPTELYGEMIAKTVRQHMQAAKAESQPPAETTPDPRVAQLQTELETAQTQNQELQKKLDAAPNAEEVAALLKEVERLKWVEQDQQARKDDQLITDAPDILRNVPQEPKLESEEIAKRDKRIKHLEDRSRKETEELIRRALRIRQLEQEMKRLDEPLPEEPVMPGSVMDYTSQLLRLRDFKVSEVLNELRSVKGETPVESVMPVTATSTPEPEAQSQRPKSDIADLKIVQGEHREVAAQFVQMRGENLRGDLRVGDQGRVVLQVENMQDIINIKTHLKITGDRTVVVINGIKDILNKDILDTNIEPDNIHGRLVISNENIDDALDPFIRLASKEQLKIITPDKLDIKKIGDNDFVIVDIDGKKYGAMKVRSYDPRAQASDVMPEVILLYGMGTERNTDAKLMKPYAIWDGTKGEQIEFDVDGEPGQVRLGMPEVGQPAANSLAGPLSRDETDLI